MKSLARAVENLLQQEQGHYERTDKVGVFRSGFRSENGFFPSYVETCDAERIVRVYTVAPLTVPRSPRSAAAAFLMRINEHLPVGQLALGMEHGEVICETGVMLGRSELHPDIMRHLLFANWWAMDLYFPAVRMVVLRKMTPQQAIDVVERRPEIPDETGPRELLGGRLSDILRGSMN